MNMLRCKAIQDKRGWYEQQAGRFKQQARRWGAITQVGVQSTLGDYEVDCEAVNNSLDSIESAATESEQRL